MRTIGTPSSYDIASTVLAAGLGLFAGWVDLHTTEVTATIVVLLAASLLMGVVQPKGAWRWALILALGLPAMVLVSRTRGLSTAEPVRLDIRIVLVAFGFGLIGAYIGVAFRRGLAALFDVISS